tara:strand:- start:3814 stop:5076 length:1263 start_codon:yes stop_codon:yes gene_type:complete
VAAFQSRTREEIRRSIAANLDQAPASSASGNGSTTTLLDTSYIGGDDEFNGGWLVFTSGTNDGLIRRVTDYASSTGTFTFKPAVTASTATNDTYEYWRAEYPPDRIHEFINQSITQRTPRGLVINEDISNHGHIKDSRYDIPSAMVAVTQVDYRHHFSGEQIQDANLVWTEQVDSDVTMTKDTQDFKANNASSRLYITSSVSSGDILASHAIGSKDLRRYDAVEFWIKSSTATSAGNITLCLSSAANLGTIKETLSVPALSARTWTYCRVSLANPEDDNAIISVGLKYETTGARYVWINDIKAVETESAVYNRLWSGTYRVDREARKVFLSESARKEVGYSLVRLIGYNLPSLLSSDSATCEIDPDLVVARATSKALFSLARGRTTDPDDNDRRAAYFEGIAAQAERSLPAIRPGTKMVD